MTVKAHLIKWSFAYPSAPRIPATRIKYGDRQLVIPLSEARNLSDQLHDLVDEYTRERTQ